MQGLGDTGVIWLEYCFYILIYQEVVLTGPSMVIRESILIGMPLMELR